MPKYIHVLNIFIGDMISRHSRFYLLCRSLARLGGSALVRLTGLGRSSLLAGSTLRRLARLGGSSLLGRSTLRRLAQVLRDSLGTLTSLGGLSVLGRASHRRGAGLRLSLARRTRSALVKAALGGRGTDGVVRLRVLHAKLGACNVAGDGALAALAVGGYGFAAIAFLISGHFRNY